jgi:hypothetical protein
VIQASEAPAAGVDDGDAEGEGGEGGVRYGGIDDGFNVALGAVGNRCLGIDAGEPYTEPLVNQIDCSSSFEPLVENLELAK